MFTGFNAQKTHQFSHIVHCCSSVSPLCFSACLFQATLPNTQSALIGHITHAWTSTANNNGVAVRNQFLRAILATLHELCEWDTWWSSLMSQSHRIKGGTTDNVFQECSVGERSSCWCRLWTFIFYMHNNLLYIRLWFPLKTLVCRLCRICTICVIFLISELT